MSNCCRCLYYESHRCRNEKSCPAGMKYVEYTGSLVRQCLEATTEIFQDGYVHCPILESTGCVECEKRFGDGSSWEYDESQNYERKPRWREVRELAKKKAVEQKTCPHFRESSGPAMPSMYIVCECGRTDFRNEEEFCRQFDICNHKPKECGLQLLHKEVAQLDKSLKHWNHLKEFGGQDPFWSDGSNMNLVRNHICYHKAEIEKICTKNGLALPEIYYKETPPEVERDYVARADEIRLNAKRSLEVYKSDKNYKYLLSAVNRLNKKEKEQTCISNVINYATGLEQYIEADKLVDMRRHEDPERHQTSFRECAERVRAILGESDKESLFDVQKCRVCGCTDDNACPGGCYWVEDDLCSRCAEKDTCYDCEHFDGKNELFRTDYCKELRMNLQTLGICSKFTKKKEEAQVIKEAQNNNSKCIGCTYWPPKGSNRCNRIGVDREVTENSVRCGWYHNLKTGETGPFMYDELYGKPMPAESEVNIDNAHPTNESPAENTALEASVSNTVQEFDYSTVDQETAKFLQEKANRITEIRIKSVVAIGKELKEAQDKLANYSGGTFVKWFESIGLKKDTVYRNINAYEWVFANCENIELADSIQPSLLFAVSKPSAPKELQEAVLTGDITSHKQYKEMEEKLRDAERRAKLAEDARKMEYDMRMANQKSDQLAREELQKRKQELTDKDIRIRELKQQLEQAKRNGDPSKVQELGQRIAEYQQEIESLEDDKKTLTQEINNLRKQLKEKPIEVPAIQTVEKEVIPDEVARAIYDKVYELYQGLIGLTPKEINIFVEQMDADYYALAPGHIDIAIEVLNSIKKAISKANTEPQGPEGYCGDCVHADMDAVTEEQLDEGKTLCKITNQIVDFDHSCKSYQKYWRKP